MCELSTSSTPVVRSVRDQLFLGADLEVAESHGCPEHDADPEDTKPQPHCYLCVSLHQYFLSVYKKPCYGF